MKLYEISENYRAFMAAVDAGEISEDAVADTLDGIEGEFEQKSDNIACLIKELRLEAQAIKEEADRLTARQRQKQAAADRLARYLQAHMQAMGKGKIETARNRITIKKNPVSCKILDEDTVLGFLQLHGMADCYKQETTIKKRELLMRLKDGDEIPGAELDVSERIEIK